MKKGDKVKIVKWDNSFSKELFPELVGKELTLIAIDNGNCVIDELYRYVCEEDEIELSFKETN